MESRLKIDKRLKAGEYEEGELLTFLQINDISILYNTLSIVAKLKPSNLRIIERVEELADGGDELSKVGLSNLEIQYVAIATLWSLGIDKQRFSLTEDELSKVKSVYYQNTWAKSVTDNK